MKTQILAAALAAIVLAATGPAFASSCPKHMAAIDKTLASNPKLDAATMKKVMELRASGEVAHKAGDHAKSMTDLSQAEKLLGISK